MALIRLLALALGDICFVLGCAGASIAVAYLTGWEWSLLAASLVLVVVGVLHGRGQPS